MSSKTHKKGDKAEKDIQDVEISVASSKVSKKQMNLNTVRRIDSLVAGVVDNANHVAIYEIVKVHIQPFDSVLNI